MNADYQSLCFRLLRAIDSGNAEAEEHVLCQIRAALKAEVEHDALDAVLGSDGARSAASPAKRSTPAPAAAPEPAEAPSETSLQRKLEDKLNELGITPYGIKTVLALTESESIDAMAENKATALLKAVGADHIKMFNQGKNSKGAQIIPAPVQDQLSAANSIDELAKAAEEAFGDD